MSRGTSPLVPPKWDKYAKEDETTALHHAIKKHAPLYVIKVIVDAFPGALNPCNMDDKRMLPLHFAISEKARLDIVALLVEAGPPQKAKSKKWDHTGNCDIRASQF
jgi:ankyrin repeat protein